LGLLDSFAFSPQSYSGVGGLLSNLPSWAYQIPLGVGFGRKDKPLQYGQTANGAVGDYQMPVFGSAPQLPTDISARAIAPQELAEPGILQQASSGLGDRLTAGLSSFAQGGRNGGLIGAMTGAASGFASGVSPENQTVKALVARGLDASTAQTVARDPTLLRSVLPQLMGTAGKTDDIKEFEYAKLQGFKGTLEQWMQRKRAGAGEYGLQPVWGTDKDGNPAVIQLGKSGEAVASKVPEGFKIARDPIKVEGPTGTTLLDPQTRQQIGYIPKDLRGAEIQKAEGEAQGAAKVNLPNILAKSQQTLDIIDKMIAHPGRETATGLSGTLDLRNYVGGTDAKNFQVMAKQLEGKAFLEAFESLKGAGAITEVEGAKATSAIARLDRAQSDGEYLAALNDLRGIVAAGMERAKAKATGITGPQAVSAVSAGPSVDDLLKKYGGR